MNAPFVRAQHARRRRPASELPVRLVALLGVIAAAAMTVAPSTGDALTTTETVKADNTVDTRPYVQEWGAYNATVRPHLGAAFSDGSSGYLQFTLFNGEAPPEPIPTVGPGERIIIKTELPPSLRLDRDGYLRGPAHNWCAGLPDGLRDIFGTLTCDETTHSNGSTTMTMTLVPDRELTADIFREMNKLTLGFGVRGTAAATGASSSAHINVLFPHATSRPRIGEATYQTSAQSGSSLGIWDLQVINQSWIDAPSPAHWSGDDTGVIQFDLTSDARPVRMSTGESFRFDIRLFRGEAYFEVPPAADWCDGLVPSGFTARCEVDGAAPGNVSVEVTREGVDTDDAFPGGHVISIPVKAISDSTTEGDSTATIWSDMAQAGSARTHASAHTTFEPGFGVPETGPVEDLRGTSGVNVVFAPDGKTAYATVLDGPASAIRIVDVASNKQSGSIQGIDALGVASKTAISPDGRWLYVGYNRGGIGVVDLQTHTQVGMVEGYTGGDRIKWALELTPDGKQLYVATEGSTSVQVIDTATHSQVDSLETGRQVQAIAIAPTGDRAFVAYNALDGQRAGIAVVDVATAAILDKVEPPRPWSGATTLTLTKDGKTLYAGVPIDGMTIIDTETLSYGFSTGDATRDVLAFALSPDESFGIVSSAYTAPNQLHIYDTRTRKIIGSVGGYSGNQAVHIRFSPDGSKAYVMSSWGNIMSVLTPRGAITP